MEKTQTGQNKKHLIISELLRTNHYTLWKKTGGGVVFGSGLMAIGFWLLAIGYWLLAKS